MSELPDQTFELLGIDPIATQELIGAGALVCAGEAASTETRGAVADAISDPPQGLSSELAYPIGLTASQLADWRRLVSADAELGALVAFAEQLSGLNQANFLAEAAAHRPGTPELLYGFIKAYSQIEVMEIYDQVRDARRLAELPPPSLVEMRTALNELVNLQCERLISAYSEPRELAVALDACAEILFEEGNQQFVGVLGRLATLYAEVSIDLRSRALAEVELACDQIEEADGIAPVESLAEALDRWLESSRPILRLGDHLRVQGRELPTPLDRLRSLIIDLALNARYAQAIEVASLSQHRLNLVPNAVEALDEAAIPARQALRTQQARAIALARKKAAPTSKSAPTKPRFQAAAYVVAVAIILGAGVFTFRLWSPSLIGASVYAPTTSTRSSGDEEVAPAAGTQQRLTLANLRYCRFQEERLGLVRPRIKTPKQVQVFNSLVNDYNSRCSDILFRDADNSTVQAELERNHTKIRAEAEKIILED